MTEKTTEKTTEAAAPETKEIPQVKIGGLVEPLRIRIYPDPVLRKPCEEIAEVTDWHRELAGRMAGMMKQPGEIRFGDQRLVIEAGIGLSAPQVGHSVSMLVVETGDPSGASAILNPKVVWQGKKKVSMMEGCLSFPSFQAKIVRPEQVVIQAMTLGGQEVEITADGMEARVLQHEIDHLSGVLFIDKISPARRTKLKKYLRNLTALYKRYVGDNAEGEEKSA